VNAGVKLLDGETLFNQNSRQLDFCQLEKNKMTARGIPQPPPERRFGINQPKDPLQKYGPGQQTIPRTFIFPNMAERKFRSRQINPTGFRIIPIILLILFFILYLAQ